MSNTQSLALYLSKGESTGLLVRPGYISKTVSILNINCQGDALVQEGGCLIAVPQTRMFGDEDLGKHRLTMLKTIFEQLSNPEIQNSWSGSFTNMVCAMAL